MINSTSLKRPISYIDIQKCFYIILYKRLRWIQLKKCMLIRGLELMIVKVSGFNFQMNQALDLADNTVCHVDDISIPHTWRTIESHNS